MFHFHNDGGTIRVRSSLIHQLSSHGPCKSCKLVQSCWWTSFFIGGNLRLINISLCLWSLLASRSSWFGNEKRKRPRVLLQTRPRHTPVLIGSPPLDHLALDGATTPPKTRFSLDIKWRPTDDVLDQFILHDARRRLSVLPSLTYPWYNPTSGGQSEFMDALAFIRSHPSVITPLAQFAWLVHWDNSSYLKLCSILDLWRLCMRSYHILIKSLLTMWLQDNDFDPKADYNAFVGVVYNHLLTLSGWAQLLCSQEYLLRLLLNARCAIYLSECKFLYIFPQMSTQNEFMPRKKRRAKIKSL